MISTETKIVTVYSFDRDTSKYLGSFEYRWDIGTGLPAYSTIVEPPNDVDQDCLVWDIQTNDWIYLKPEINWELKYNEASRNIKLLSEMLEDEDFSIKSIDEIKNDIQLYKNQRIEARRHILKG